jgi:chorismate mutase
MVTIPFMDPLKIEKLKPYRKRIDAVDDQIIDLLGRRLDIIKEVAVLKACEGIDPVLQSRVDEVRDRCIKAGKAKGYDEEVMHAVYSQLIEFSCKIEQDYQDAQSNRKDK